MNFDNLISVSSKVGNTWSASSKFFTVAQFNPRSVGQLEKRSNINDFILDHKVDFFSLCFCIAESWLRPRGVEAKRADLASPGYRTICPRSSRGGGIALLVHESLCPHLTTTTHFPFRHRLSFELTHLSISLHQHCLQLVCLYRPPPNGKNKLTDALFFSNSFLICLNTVALRKDVC